MVSLERPISAPPRRPEAEILKPFAPNFMPVYRLLQRTTERNTPLKLGCDVFRN